MKRFQLCFWLMTFITFSSFAVEGDVCSDQTVLWWYDLNAPSFGSAAVDDIDGDGYAEIVFGCYFNDERIHALNGENGTLHWSYSTGGCNDASPVIADVDLDNELEVVVPASSPYRVYCFDGRTGSIEWQTSTGYPNCIDSPPAVADVDNDGRPEVILGTFYGNVFCLNGEDGSICWQVNLGANSYIQSGPNILDCDSDGQLDVVVAQWLGDYRVYALRGNDGSTLWFSSLPEDNMYHGGSFADIDEDGRPEIVIGCYDGDVYAFNAEDGSLLWEYQGVLYVGAPTSIADLNNDGHLEIVFTSYTSLKVLSHTGVLLWTHSTGGSIFRGAAIADVDGDGILDVVFGSDDGILRALRGSDGGVVWAHNLQLHYGRTFEMDHAPVIADFNNDDSLDVFIIGGYGTSSNPTLNHGRGYALTAGRGSGPGWPMFRHDKAHSGCFHYQESAVSIVLTPHNPPITIPPNGGGFVYEASLRNNSSAPLNFDAWTMATLPDGREYGPLLLRQGLTIGAGDTLSRVLAQSVPGNAPAGRYVYAGFVGLYPDSVAGSDSFPFEKTAGEGAFSYNQGWELFGWDVEEGITKASANESMLIANPNPFNAQVAASFEMRDASRIKLSIFDITGREVAVLAEGFYPAGHHSMFFDASGMASGVYFARLEAGGKIDTRKLLLVK